MKVAEKQYFRTCWKIVHFFPSVVFEGKGVSNQEIAENFK